MKSYIKKSYAIIIIWAFGFFLRSYRQSSLLGFYYDQGRDALIATDIITLKNFPAIGPTTGIEGLYLGPFWFYLLAPAYFISAGSPVFAAIFISFIESLTIPLIYYLVKKYYHRPKLALFIASLWAFSHYIIRSSRWFSNPSPLPTFALLIMLCLLKIFANKKTNYWPLLFFLFGLSLQLEAASAIFFAPIIIIFSLSNIKTLKQTKIKTWLLSVSAFIVLLLPQLAFEAKNNFITTKALFGFISGQVNSSTGQTWAIPDLNFVLVRLRLFYRYLSSKLDTNSGYASIIFSIIFLFGLIKAAKRQSHLLIRLLFIWFFLPLIALLFFSGNYGNLYDYYLTGLYPAFFILFAISAYLIFNSKKPRLLLFLLITILFIHGNFIHIYYYLIAGVDGPEHVTLGNQLQAVDYICHQNPDQTQISVNSYVPSITPYTYDYLFYWRHQHHLCPAVTTKQLDQAFYILYEVDTIRPSKRIEWLSQFQNYQTLSQKQFGGITVDQKWPN